MNTKRILFIILLLAASIMAFGQTAPEKRMGIGYQAMVRQADGKPLASKIVTVKISINKESATGEVLFTETHGHIITSPTGLLSLEIGSVEKAAFDAIDWANIKPWISVEVTTDKGETVQISQEMQAVPYAYYAKKVDGLDELKAKIETIESGAPASGNLEELKTQIEQIKQKLDSTISANQNNTDSTFLADQQKIKEQINELQSQITDSQANIQTLQQEVKTVAESKVDFKEVLDKLVKEEDAATAFNTTHGKDFSIWTNAPANVTAEVYIFEELDSASAAYIAEALPSPFDPTTHMAKYEGKIPLTLHKNGAEFELNMEDNAMGLNELCKYIVVYGLIGSYQDMYYDATMYPNGALFSELTGWNHKDKESLGKANIKLKGIKIGAPDPTTNISKLEFIGPYKDAYGDIKAKGMPFEIEYSPLNKLMRILADPTNPNYDRAKTLINVTPDPDGGTNHTYAWQDGVADPIQHIFDCDFEALDDLDHDANPPYGETLDEIAKITGEINWETSEIKFKFPTVMSPFSEFSYVYVTITPGE